MLLFNKRRKQVKLQYKQPDLYKNILDGLKKKRIDLDNVSREDVSGVDEFHIRGAEVSHELVRQFNFRNLRVLDIGCGLGGPSRMLADNYNCKVYGIDLNSDYIKTARKLNHLIEGTGDVNFLVADALNLPFSNGMFDVVWTQHVQMNIEDKKRFYSEINRVLNKDGALVYYDIFKRNGQDIKYPVPWANSNKISFLQTKEDMKTILNQLGFIKERVTNQTKDGQIFLEKLKSNFDNITSNSLGLNMLLGESMKVKFSNVLDAMELGKIELESGIYRKP